MATAFYIAGGALVLIAILISFFGMRNENFPSDGALRAGVAFVFAVVAVTAFLAVKASKEEAQNREDEQNREAAVEEQSATDANQVAGAEGDGSSSTPAPIDAQGATGSASAGDATAGAQVFTDQGCGGCHSLAANSSTGQIGPNLDEALVDKDEAFIETSIVDPGDFVEEGFSDGIMPTTYADDIPPDQLPDLVSYLFESTRAK